MYVLRAISEREGALCSPCDPNPLIVLVKELFFLSAAPAWDPLNDCSFSNKTLYSIMKDTSCFFFKDKSNISMLSSYDSLGANFFKQEDHQSTFYPPTYLPTCLPVPVYPSVCTHALNISVKSRF